jgi:hypothetical protein
VKLVAALARQGARAILPYHGSRESLRGAKVRRATTVGRFRSPTARTLRGDQGSGDRGPVRRLAAREDRA